uniref:NEDD8-activating enzyme E1 regulatory subunit n=1 Tax=Pygocentrus nattereri TaxID=42514 RepID=A0AAR2LKR2_PYGNA
MADQKTNKEQRYDRQLRLWGDHGQEALENAHTCLLNATATGTEILKNLILPGIGAFTIVDGHRVTGEDVGNKVLWVFMVLYRPNRAQAATEFLQELNSDVSGNFVEESPDKLLDNDPEFFHRFSLVIGVQLPESTCLRLGSVLWSAGVPFLVCRTYGLVGYMRLVVKEHTVVESHPDNALEDLRLDQPFTELKNHISTYDLDSMEKKDHSHTPWIVVVAKYLENWCNEHDLQVPKNYKEKEAFRQLIREGIRKNESGAPEEEENFDEAIKNVNTALNPTKISSAVDDIFNSEQCENITSQTAAFWLMARGVRDFVQNEGNGSLPVRGTIPDMIADSDKFISLQNVYREKALQDAAVVAKHIQSHLQAVGKPPESISEQDVKLFCKNAAFLRVVRCRSLAEEYSVDSFHKDTITSCMDSPDSEMVLYLMLRAVDRFYQQHSRYPGVYNYQVEEDISTLKLCVNSLLQEYSLNVNVKDDYVHEFCRYGAAEPHTVASFLGGAAAQEAIKLITHQFVPFNNTFIYNAMAQTSTTFQL